jgi:hypothetical protein
MVNRGKMISAVLRRFWGIVVLAILALCACGGLAESRSDAGKPDGPTSEVDAGPPDSDTDRRSDAPSDSTPDDVTLEEDGGCPSGESPCSGVCVNEQTDGKNCGGCGLRCSVPCIAGECLETLASGQDSPQAIAVDTTSVYWTNNGQKTGRGSIAKMPIGGGKPGTLATGPQGEQGLAVDSASVYWANGNNGTVMKVPLDGGKDETVASGQGVPARVAVSPTHVYWVNAASGTVVGMPLDGGTSVTLASGQDQPFGIALSAASAYWTDQLAGTVMSTPLASPPDGGALITLASGQGGTDLASEGPTAIAVGDTSAYWVTGYSVASVPLLGGTPTTLFSVTEGGPYLGIAVDATSVYWTSFSGAAGGAVLKVPRAGGAAVTIAPKQTNPWGIAVDATSVYWTTDSEVMRLTPK